jgi:hypothetical protein
MQTAPRLARDDGQRHVSAESLGVVHEPLVRLEHVRVPGLPSDRYRIAAGRRGSPRHVGPDDHRAEPHAHPCDAAQERRFHHLAAMAGRILVKVRSERHVLGPHREDRGRPRRRRYVRPRARCHGPEGDIHRDLRAARRPHPAGEQVGLADEVGHVRRLRPRIDLGRRAALHDPPRSMTTMVSDSAPALLLVMGHVDERDADFSLELLELGWSCFLILRSSAPRGSSSSSTRGRVTRRRASATLFF